MTPIYTIGYAGHTWESFRAVLGQYGITAVADVRSAPYSKFTPEFSYKALQAALARIEIAYVFLGDLCGARPEDPACYIDGVVSFERLAAGPDFQKGLARLCQGAETFTVAMLCAEKDPLTCHRTILISRHLCHDRGVKIRHILPDGTCQDHGDTEQRLLDLLGLGTDELPGLGRSREERLAEAYRRQAQRITGRKADEAKP